MMIAIIINDDSHHAADKYRFKKNCETSVKNHRRFEDFLHPRDSNGRCADGLMDDEILWFR